MNKTIWKFELEIADDQTIEMPVDSEILTVQTQNEIPCIWALVDPTAEKEIRHIKIYGTGHDIPYNQPKKYLGTFQLKNGAIVFHVCEKRTM